jgi:hypothetical protein
MDIGSRIQQMEEIVREAKSMPLSASALLNREEVLEMLAAMRDALPEEIKQARWVVRDREELLAKARRDADAVLARARQEQARLVQQEAVVQAAQEEAERIVSDARDQARQVRMEADDYVDGKLAQFEIILQRIQEALASTQDTLAESVQRVQGALDKTSDQVTRGREKLAGPLHPAQVLAPEAPVEPVAEP